MLQIIYDDSTKTLIPYIHIHGIKAVCFKRKSTRVRLQIKYELLYIVIRYVSHLEIEIVLSQIYQVNARSEHEIQTKPFTIKVTSNNIIMPSHSSQCWLFLITYNTKCIYSVKSTIHFLSTHSRQGFTKEKP